ncbi:OmpA family protein [Chondromyces apiculatus]|uniref:Flagellar motor rotation protein MotB n=1 Tax=Chondromyces apiculatus DSM 436 TaxID=1192034 RepID=A0A017T009_9BACT|nr:OmpA family protein [Chondromyces apiculatus]EYF02357.1 Flagellar motor rotation protein MotB [Chondromyces apiculatus DSM 436]
MLDPAATPEEESSELSAIWPVFGDLMACLFGLFVLFFVWAVAFQVDLAGDLEAERAARAEERARLETLERALAGPLAAGRITLTDGRIGIRGSILFGLGSAELQPEGTEVLEDIAPALQAYLAEHDELIMVSGFTDDQAVAVSARSFQDNWELSVQRALKVTRALAAAGVPSGELFAAGFGEAHPVAPNDTPENRARNRRVEISPIPRHHAAGSHPAPAGVDAR